MFNPKERLQQIRKNKSVREEVNSYIAEKPSPPLFQQPKAADSQDLVVRISKLENIVNQLSTQLESSKSVISSLRKDNNDLETKVLKLQYQNSQLKVQTKVHQQPARRPLVQTDKFSPQREEKEVRKSQSCVTENQQLMSEVQESLEQIKREPIENILKRKEHNFRALKADPRQINSGNKVLKEFAAICKDYHKTLKKPLLVLQLQSSDFE